MVCELHAKNNCPLPSCRPVQPNPVTGMLPNAPAPQPVRNADEPIPPIEMRLADAPMLPVAPPHTDPLAISITEAAAQYADAREDVASLTEKVKAMEVGLASTREGLTQAMVREETARQKMSGLIFKPTGAFTSTAAAIRLSDSENYIREDQ